MYSQYFCQSLHEEKESFNQKNYIVFFIFLYFFRFFNFHCYLSFLVNPYLDTNRSLKWTIF